MRTEQPPPNATSSAAARAPGARLTVAGVLATALAAATPSFTRAGRNLTGTMLVPHVTPREPVPTGWVRRYHRHQDSRAGATPILAAYSAAPSPLLVQSATRRDHSAALARFFVLVFMRAW